MQIKINQELMIETEIPFLTVQDFVMNWEINKHAEVSVKGVIKNEYSSGLKSHVYEQEIVTFLLTGEEMNKESVVLFCGLVEALDLVYSDGITYAIVQIRSASQMLDRKKVRRAFQDTSQTYSEAVREMSALESGEVISTVDEKQLGNPVICYGETIWEFEKRLASFQNSLILPDIITGRPNIWFGMRRGKQIPADLSVSKFSIKIYKSYTNGEKGTARRYYSLETANSYLLGDWLNIYGRKYIIYKKKCSLEHYHLKYIYHLAEETNLKTKPYYNTALIGLSLVGTVEQTENEEFKICLDVDGKSGSYFYSWRPEVGNVLYVMPEKNVKVALYFMTHKDESGIGIWYPGGIKEGSGETQNKLFKNADNLIALRDEDLEISRNNNGIQIADDSKVEIFGEYLDIYANGNIKLTAKRIRLIATSEIKAVTST